MMRNSASTAWSTGRLYPLMPEVLVAVVVVTRLRLADRSFLDDFFAAAVGLFEQAKGSPGLLDADVLAEANDTWSSCTVWQDRETMSAYVTTDPHHATMSRLDDWCDQNSFVDWEQTVNTLPDWPTAHRRLVAEEHSATLAHASPDNTSLRFPPPVVAMP